MGGRGVYQQWVEEEEVHDGGKKKANNKGNEKQITTCYDELGLINRQGTRLIRFFMLCWCLHGLECKVGQHDLKRLVVCVFSFSFVIVVVVSVF